MHHNSHQSGDAATGLVTQLTERESDILLMAALGYSDTLVARLMKVSVRTVEGHRRELFRKLGIGTVDGLEALIAGSLQHRAESGAVGTEGSAGFVRCAR
ncbi:MAG: hypothetical protein A3H93_14740 [Rhodocyclales bacterium RIFCSPLOWO2_02_FULL_63_24]|nr:MAG: hypothetical protein A3H93_14740 [Rhodocyclales bacterium RIFCSPLOWO2_02_FULL_63_24]